MPIEVILDIFSGRPNPRWVLSTDDEREVLRVIERIETPTLMKPSGVTGKLGYRGFIIRRPSDSAPGGMRMMIHEGIVDFGQDKENRIADNRDVEELLLSTAPSDLVEEEVRNEVALNLNQPVPETAALFSARAAAAAVACPGVQAADAPSFTPGLWNVATVQPFNNCYNYANDQITNTYAQPGDANGVPIVKKGICLEARMSAVADALTPTANFNQPLGAGQGWYLALVVRPGLDFHWYRQDIGGCWSHKPGGSAARNTDDSGNAITDPRLCDRGNYTTFCGFMMTNRGVIIR